MRERGEGRIFARGEILWCQYYFHGQQIRMPCLTDKGEKCRVGQDERQAEKFLKRKLAQVMSGVHGPVTHLRYEDVRDALVADYGANGRKSLRKDKNGKLYIDCIKALDNFFSGWKCSEIDAGSVRRFQKEQKDKGLANGTVNRSVSMLRRMFSLAHREERLREVPYFPFLTENAPRSGFVEMGDYQRLYDALPAFLRPVLGLAFWTGMRRGEILNLKWDQIDFIGGTIRLKADETKNGFARTIPIASPLHTLLLAEYQRRQPSCPFVCTKTDRLGHARQIGNFRKIWQNRCVKLGLAKWEPTGETEVRTDRPKAKPKEKMIYGGLVLHDMRRTCVRNLVRAQVPERIAREISGHRSRSVFDRYNIVSENDLVNAGRQLEAYLEKFGDKTGTVLHQDAAGDLPVQ